VGAIAFFDFDGTLVRHDSGVICAVPSVRRGLLGPRIFAELVVTWLLSKAGLRARTDAMRVGFRCYAGHSRDELRAIVHALYDEHLRADLSAPVLEHVRAHRAQGDRLTILTASASFLVEPAAVDLGFDEWVGTEVGFAGGRCTGLVDGEILDGHAKLRAAQRAAEVAGVGLDRCTFYSDHIADLPLLEAVGTPVVVGSSRALGKVARTRGWRVVPHGAKMAS
jgi:putative phosphoserine phosphatase/1-acylglycerol-3-phosphate O-acyltransferase